MQLTIIRDDNVVIVDGRAMSVDLSTFSGLPANLHAVQWDGASGHIEYNDGTLNEPLMGISAFSDVVAAWTAARDAADAPPSEPTPEEILASRLAAIEAKYEVVFGRLRSAMSVAMLADGPGMDAKVAALRAEWSSASSAQSAEIAALIGG